MNIESGAAVPLPAVKISAANQAAAGNVSNSGYGVSNAADLNNAILQAKNISKDNNQYSSDQASLLREWQAQQTRNQNMFNAEEAAKNRKWQEYMSNSAHQREIADLKAAGLNPVLSAMGGNGAAVTSGATASGSAPSGAKGETDTSANTAITSILGSFLSAQTQLEAQRVSAASNQAIAERNNATAELIAQIYGEYGLMQADVHGKYGIQQSRTSANAMMGAAYTAAQASMANTALSARSASELQSKQQEHDEYIRQNYPSNAYGTAAAIANAISGDGGWFDALKGLFSGSRSGAGRNTGSYKSAAAKSSSTSGQGSGSSVK